MYFPYLLTTVLYLFIALLAAVDVSLVSLDLVPAFATLRWFRVHFVTLGIITQAVFGLLPGLVASLTKQPRPAMRWSTWLALNGGLVLLVAGFFGVNQPLILTGGTLVFSAVLLLGAQLWQLRSGPLAPSVKFYLVGLLYLLVGIIIGTGLWLNWSPVLRIQVPLEAHIHANSWGFMSLVFAGLLVDFVPLITGQPLGSKKAVTYIFWAMTVGAFGLVLAPWLGGSLPPTVVGIVLHLSATISLVVLLIRRMQAAQKLNTPGAWHLVLSYLWIIAPVLAAPLILLGVVAGGPIETTAPQALIYGWVLQFGIALVPFAARYFILKEKHPALGGSWVSLAGATLGSLLVWASIFIAPARGALYGIGFAAFAIALVPPLLELAQVASTKLREHDLA